MLIVALILDLITALLVFLPLFFILSAFILTLFIIGGFIGLFIILIGAFIRGVALFSLTFCIGLQQRNRWRVQWRVVREVTQFLQ